MFYSEKVASAEKETDAQKKAARVYVEYKNKAEFDRRFADTFAAIKVEGRTVKIKKSDLPAPSDILKGGKTNPERTFIKELIRSLYGNDTISFQRNGKRVDAYFTKDGRKHIADWNNSNEKAYFLHFARELAASAQYSFSSPHDEHSTDGAGNQIDWDYFCAVFDVENDDGTGGTKYDILFTLKDISDDAREQIYKAEIKKETPYRHKGAETKASVATSNYTGFGVSDGNDTTASGKLQASEKTGDRTDLEVLQQAYADSVETPEQQQAMVSFREQVQRYEDARSALTIAQTDDKNESTPASRKAKPEAQRTFNREQKILAGMVNNNADLRKVINAERSITTKTVNTADREAFNERYRAMNKCEQYVIYSLEIITML